MHHIQIFDNFEHLLKSMTDRKYNQTLNYFKFIILYCEFSYNKTFKITTICITTNIKIIH